MTEATSRGQNRTAGAAGGAESPKDLPVAGLFDRLRSSKRGLRRDVRPSLTRCVGSGGRHHPERGWIGRFVLPLVMFGLLVVVLVIGSSRRPTRASYRLRSSASRHPSSRCPASPIPAGESALRSFASAHLQTASWFSRIDRFCLQLLSCLWLLEMRGSTLMARNLQNQVIDISAARASHRFRTREPRVSPCSVRPFSPRPRLGRAWVSRIRRALDLLFSLFGRPSSPAE